MVKQSRDKAEEKKPRKIAIVGTANSYLDAPYDNEAWEIWGLVGLYNKLPKGTRVDRYFELHTFDYLARECKAKPEFFEMIKSLGDKMTLFQKEQMAPEAKALRKDELIAAFGTYWTSSIAWMIGEAILENPDAVGLWGVHSTGTNEIKDQKGCIEGYIRFLQGMQKEVYIHPNSSLFKAPMYCTDEFVRLKKGIEYADKLSNQAFDTAQYWKGYKDGIQSFKNGVSDYGQPRSIE